MILVSVNQSSSRLTREPFIFTNGLARFITAPSNFNVDSFLMELFFLVVMIRRADFGPIPGPSIAGSRFQKKACK